MNPKNIFREHAKRLRNYIERLRIVSLSKKKGRAFSVGLTYANDLFHRDGIGSQLQRIYGIYCLTRLFNTRYIHSPIAQLTSTNWNSLELYECDSAFLQEVNDFYSIPSDITVPSDAVVFDIPRLGVADLIQLKRQARKHNRFVLGRIHLPYAILDCFPEAYEVLQNITPFRAPKRTALQSAMHVRKGELSRVAPERLLPNSYFANVADTLTRAVTSLGLHYEFDLYTEIAQNDFESAMLWDFDHIPGIRKHWNLSPLVALERMGTADILVMSHSSYSYTAGLLNPGGIVIYNAFWHSPLPHWITAGKDGSLPWNRLVSAIDALHRARVSVGSPSSDKATPLL